MCRSDPLQIAAGHRKAAPMLAVSGTAFLPDTLPDTGEPMLARLYAKVSGCPAETHSASRVHARTRAHNNTHTSNGHPDTLSIHAGLRCPVPKFVADTAGHLRIQPDTTMSDTKKPMREAMPAVAEWIDSLREAFGAEAIEGSMRAGMRGEPNKFYAAEAGHQVGTQFDREVRQ